MSFVVEFIHELVTRMIKSVQQNIMKTRKILIHLPPDFIYKGDETKHLARKINNLEKFQNFNTVFSAKNQRN